MRNTKFMLLALLMGAMTTMTASAQSDPLSVSRTQATKTVTYPTYSTGGYKYIVRNNTTGQTQVKGPDTVNSSKFKVKTQAGTTAITIDTTGTYLNSGKLYVGATTASPIIRTGTGTPLYVVKAPVGSLYLRTNGVADSTLYVKSTGTDSAGWRPLTTH